MKKTAVYQRKRASDPGWYNTWIQSPMWLKGFGIGLVICGLAYFANILWDSPRPGGTWGIAYGVGALVLFILLSLYGIRRYTRRVKGLHRAWYILQFHVYGGVFFLVLVLMHTNFSMPQGLLTGLLWGASIWIVFSGLLGNVLQKWIPRQLSTGLSTEVNFGRIPELIAETKKRAEQCVASAGEPLQIFYAEEIAPLLQAPRPRWGYFLDTAGSVRRYAQRFSLQKRILTASDAGVLDELQRLVEGKLEIDAHFTLQRVLRWWLFLHVPVSLFLAALIAAHLVAVFYY